MSAGSLLTSGRVSAGMGSAIDRRELTFKALAGLVGGAIGWIPVEVVSNGHSLTETPSNWQVAGNFLAMALMAGMIGGLVLAADDHSLEITPRAKSRFLRGFAVCFTLSFPATYYSDVAFGAILSAGGWGVNQPGLAFYMVLARVVGWTLMGLMLGIGVGLATLSVRNLLKGAAGGCVGGFVGGLTFDLIGSLSQTGLASRLVGLSAIGLAIGLFIGLVQELTKAAWLAVEAGRLKGRQFRLEGASVTLGRAEENPVGLFGDPGVQPRHARIEKTGAGYALKNLAVQEGTFVNGNRIETVELHDGDRIRIGNYEMVFHERTAAGGAHLSAPAGSPSGYAPSPSPAGAAAVSSSNGAAYLTGATGERYAIRFGATTRLGRALDNDIVIQDASVSRYHAAIEAANGAFRVRDLGSQNGTWLGDKRIEEAPLASGDAVKLGDARFTFHV
jgi:pSer/pThr/pTyr-binding forkhead associated (FHA) protein